VLHNALGNLRGDPEKRKEKKSVSENTLMECRYGSSTRRRQQHPFRVFSSLASGRWEPKRTG